MNCGSRGLVDVEVVFEAVGVDHSHDPGISRRARKQFVGGFDHKVLRHCDVRDAFDAYGEGLCHFDGDGVLDVGVGHFGNLSSLS